MRRSMVAGALSGAVVTAAIWMIAEYVWDGIGAVVGGLLSLGPPAPPPPSLSLGWARYGFAVGLLTGAAVGLVAGLTGRGGRGRNVGAAAAVVCWALSGAAVLYVTGSELLGESLFGLAAAVLGGAVLLGALVGASADLLLKRLGRREGAGSGL